MRLYDQGRMLLRTIDMNIYKDREKLCQAVVKVTEVEVIGQDRLGNKPFFRFL